MMKIGSHVSMSAPDYLVGSVQEMLSYGANCMMLYTGAPQNFRRVDYTKFKIAEMKQRLEEQHIPLENVIVHAAYLINLANTLKAETYELGKTMLKDEIVRCDAIGASYLVLHPGSHVGAGKEKAITSIQKGLNEILSADQNCIVCLETMALKGTEVGSFEDIKQIIEGITLKDKMGVCLDTCHIHDAGMDLNDFDAILKAFDETIGLAYLKVVHLNDSKNERGAHKDRHANIDQGCIGYSILHTIAHHPTLVNIPKILETPYIEDKAPYKEEIEWLKK